MGKGRSKAGAGGALMVRNGTMSLQNYIKQLGFPNSQMATKAARYQQLQKGSAQKAFIDGLMDHGGMGSIGAIRLRTKDFGLPRDKLLDLKNLLKPLADHGLISVVNSKGNIKAAGHGEWDNNTVISTDLNRIYIKKLNNVPNDILAAIISLGH